MPITNHVSRLLIFRMIISRHLSIIKMSRMVFQLLKSFDYAQWRRTTKNAVWQILNFYSTYPPTN
jgi:hypothetical protein